MKRMTLEELLPSGSEGSYQKQYETIMQMIQQGKIKPVKSSARNGRKPALYTQYWLVEEEKDYSDLENELLYETHPDITIDYYLRHPETYLRERESVRRLHQFLRERKEELSVSVSYNERCFSIWGYEKFLTKAAGKTVLKHCGLELSFLNCYPTSEPFAYYAASRETPQNLLILENKDPFFSMRRSLLSGKSSVLGTEIGTLIYGAGKRVIRSFQEFEVSAEPYMKEEGNQILYFGDLDYEGIGIYENLKEICAGELEIIPFRAAYERMLQKAEQALSLPETSELQNRQIGNEFFSFFDQETQERMHRILGQNLYIPQEILTITDY